MKLLFALVLVAAQASGALARSIPVVLSARRCAQQVDLEEVRSILELELRSNAAGQDLAFSIALLEPEAPSDGLSASIRCGGNGTSLALQVERRMVPTTVASQLPLLDVLPQARSRLIALALAEMIRSLDPEPSPLAPQPRAVATPSSPSHRRALGNSALGLAAVSVVSVVVGAVLSGRDDDRHERRSPDGDEAAFGFAFGVGGVATVGASVDFGLWMRER